MDSLIIDIIWVLLAQLFVLVSILLIGFFIYQRIKYLGILRIDPALVYKKPQTLENAINRINDKRVISRNIS